MSEREARALITAMLSAYSEWPLNRRDMEVEVSKWLGWLRDRNALTPIPEEGEREALERPVPNYNGRPLLEVAIGRALEKLAPMDIDPWDDEAHIVQAIANEIRDALTGGTDATD